MRKLMWFTLGFTVACAVGVYLATGIWLLLLGGFCLVPMLALIRMPSLNSKRAVAALLGGVIGFAWLWCFDALYLLPVRQMDGRAALLDIEVTDYSRASEYGIAAEGKTEIQGKTYSIQFYINEEMTLSPGDRVEGGFLLRYTGGGAENPTYHRGKGIFLLGYPKGTVRAIPSESTSYNHFPPILRHRILTLLERIFPADTSPFAKALLLGEDSDLSFDTAWSLRTAGIYHVVAVSGMHVSILFALIYMVFGRNRVSSAVIGFPLLLLFSAVTGFSPSVVRASIMQGLMILALLVDREYDPPTALAAAVLVILASNPISITSVSLQLSAGCMVGMLLFSQRIHAYLMDESRLGPAKGKSLKAKVTRWFVGSVSITLGAISLTTPISAYYFGQINLLGVLANLILLQGISIVFYGIIAASVLGALWLPLGQIIGFVLSWPIRLVLWVTDMISKVPVSAVYTSSVYIVAWLIFAYVILTVFLKSKKKHPWILTCCLVVGLVGAVGLSWLEPRLDNYRVTAVDVGQGQCLVLQNEGKYYVVDCGGDSGDDAAEQAIQFLRCQGIFRVDGLILTHYDTDHAGGADQFLSKVPTDTVYLPVLDEENAIQNQLAEKYHSKIHWVTDDLVLSDADITIYPSGDVKDSNESSLCILFQPENCDILITGDRSVAGEKELMEHTSLPDLEILVAGHHGSRTSTSWELLNVTRPEVVIISVGAGNSYGHPTQETLDRLDLFGCLVYRTDLEGTIILRG